MRSNEAQRETRRKEKLDRELKHSKGELEQKTGEIKSMQSQAQRYRDDIARLETQLKEQKVSIRLLCLKSAPPQGVCISNLLASQTIPYKCNKMYGRLVDLTYMYHMGV